MTREGKKIGHGSETGKLSAADTGLVERKLLCVCSTHTSHTLLSIWPVTVIFNRRHVVSYYNMCCEVPQWIEQKEEKLCKKYPFKDEYVLNWTRDCFLNWKSHENERILH